MGFNQHYHPWNKEKEKQLDIKLPCTFLSVYFLRHFKNDDKLYNFYSTEKGRQFTLLHSQKEFWGSSINGWESLLISLPPTLRRLISKNGSVQFSHSVQSDSLWTHGLQHSRVPSPSPTPGAYTNSCPLSQWCHPAISYSIIPFSSCPQSLSASGSVPMSQIFTWGGQSIGVSASTSVLPMNTQDWSPLGRTDWIPLQSKGLSRVFSNTTFNSISSSVLSFLYSPALTSIHDYWKNHSFD